MADKTVVVRLRAVVDQYKQAMQDASGVTKGLASEAHAAFDKLSGQKMAQIGGTLTRNVTLPIIGVGVAAGKLASDFDDVFGRMQGLAGVTADEVDGLKESVLDLAGETGQAPRELAEALYFIRSSGIDGAEALEVLEVSAKGAAAGLGEAKSVADLVTSVLNAYGEANIDAAKAGDVLAATAREGKAEAGAIADQMGRLLPVASELGIEFEELGGFMAYVSREGGGAELAATNLQNVLAKLLTPAQEGVEALEDIGLSVESLQARVGRDGLIPTLQFLRDELEQNGMTLSDYSRDMQFTNGVLQVTGENFDAAMEVMGKVADSTGTLDNAFSRMADTLGFKNKQAFADLQASMIQFGDKIVPIMSDVLGVIADIAGWLTDLPGPAQTALVALLGIGAAAGPILTVFGNLKKLNEGLGKLGPAGARASGALSGFGKIGGFAVGVVILAEALRGLQDQLDPIERANVSELTNSFLEFNDTGRLTGVAADFAGEGFGKLKNAIEDANRSGVDKFMTDLSDATNMLDPFGRQVDQGKASIEDFDAAMSGLVTSGATQIAASVITDAAEAMGMSYDDLIAQLPQYRGALAEADTQQRLAGDGANNLAGDVDGVTGAYELALTALQNYADELAAQFDPLFAVTDGLLAVEEAQLAYNEAVATYGPHSVEAERATIAVARAIQGLDGDLATLLAKVESGEVSIDQARATIAGWATSYGLTGDQVAVLNALFQGNIDLANQIHGRRIVQTVETHYTVSGAIGPNTPVIPAYVAGQANIYHEGGWVTGRQGADVPAILKVGEYVLTADEARSLSGILPAGRMTSDHLVGMSRHGGVAAATGDRRPLVVQMVVGNRLLGQAVIDDWQTRPGAIPVRVEVARRTTR